MKQIIFSFVMIASISSVSVAQKYDDARNLVMIRNYKKAKEILDKNWNEKYTSKPEAYLLKANVLAGLSNDSSMSGEAANLRKEAVEAFEKYKEMDPQLALLLEPNSVYTAGPIGLYGSYFNAGIADYQKKNWPGAYENFKNAVAMSDLLSENKLIDMKLDTNGILLAGAAAQSMDNNEEAERYFVRLADAKVGGADNEFIYQFLTNRSLQSGNMGNFTKYLNLGKELYPESKYFQYDEVDYILALEDENRKIALIDQKLTESPNDYKTQSAYAEILFDKLNPKDTSDGYPQNYDELETKMVAAFEKATEMKPESGLATSNVANHFINKANRLGKELDAVRTAIREKNVAAKAAKQTAKTDPADAAKRDSLQKEYDLAVEKAMEHYEKAVGIYSKLNEPTLIEKQQHRNAVGYLIDLSAEKKNASKGTPAQYDKWEKEEKKWSDIYHKMQ